MADLNEQDTESVVSGSTERSIPANPGQGAALKTYRDSDGNECTLWALCRKEPEWAANIITELQLERDRARAELGAICVAASLKPGEEFLAEYGGGACHSVQSVLEHRDRLYFALKPFVRAYHHTAAGYNFSKRFFERISMKNLLDAVKATGIED